MAWGYKPREAGFTLLEVMVVLGIVAIAAALAFPNFVQWNSRYQLKQGTLELANTLNLARLSAMKSNANVTATLTTSAGRLQVDFAGAIPPLSLQGISTTPTTIRFSALGLCTAGSGVLQITTTTGSSYSINISQGGRIRWCANNTGTC